jgi:hypothetical protein
VPGAAELLDRGFRARYRLARYVEDAVDVEQNVGHGA